MVPFDWHVFADDLARLVAAAVLGGVLGLERQVGGHWAGLRTHMMVAVGAAVFILVGIAATTDEQSVTRVVQGVATGIGFLGAGTILKLSDEMEIKGLTTASSIWLAAALGSAAGLGEYALATAALCVSLFVLAILRPVEKAISKRRLHRRSGDD